MENNNFIQLLLGKDLRTLKKNNATVRLVKDQKSFDELFTLIFHHERTLVMRAVDAVEKITISHPGYLTPHKDQLLAVLKSADHKELKWHIAQLLPRLDLDTQELEKVWHVLSYWVLNPAESKIVRVNALQGLFDLSSMHAHLKPEFEKILDSIKSEMIPSIQARIRKLRKMKNH